MGLNKLEKQFQEKLNKREINPSEVAWDRLDVILSVNEKPKQKFTWLYFAASFIGFLLVGTIFFKTKENTLVTEKNKGVIEQSIQNDSSKTQNESVIKEPGLLKTILNEKTASLVEISKTKKNILEPQFIKTSTQIVTENQPQNQNELIIANCNSISVNIDSLLASVEKKSISDHKKSSVIINPTTLLNQVDGELQVSFREKALNTISQKYKEARAALANRNNQ